MEELEISVLNLSDVMVDNDNKRIDSEYFRKQYLKFFKEVPSLKPLGEFVKEGYRVVYENTKIIDKQEAEKGGYPYFLQATDLDTPFINTSNLFHVSNEEWVRYPKGRIKKGEILIEVKGKIDKVSIVPEDFPEKTLVTGSLFKLSVNNDISKHVLLCYLICKYGVAFKDRFKTNLLISYISKPDLYRIPVPNFSSSFQQKIDEIFKIIFKSKEKASKIYQQAETILLQEAELQGFKASTEAVNVKSFSESFTISGRLDAEYYQRKYEDFENLILNNKNGFTFINKEYEHINLKSKKDKLGYNYIEIGDVNVSDGSSTSNYVETKCLPANAKNLVKKGDLLISKVRPYRGAVTIVDSDLDDIIVSGAFTVLRERKNSLFSNEVLKVLLRTNIYKEWLLKFNVGTQYPVIKDKDVLGLPIPLINKSVQDIISSKIQESQLLKKESEHLLEVAKIAVEVAIEQNETKALKYIADKTSLF